MSTLLEIQSDMDTSIKFFWFSVFFLAQSFFVYTISHADEEPDWQHQTQIRSVQRWGEATPSDTAYTQNIVIHQDALTIQEEIKIPGSFIVEEPHRDHREREKVTTASANLNTLDFESAVLLPLDGGTYRVLIHSKTQIKTTVCITVSETQEKFCHERSPIFSITLWFMSEEARATAIKKLRDSVRATI